MKRFKFNSKSMSFEEFAHCILKELNVDCSSKRPNQVELDIDYLKFLLETRNDVIYVASSTKELEAKGYSYDRHNRFLYHYLSVDQLYPYVLVPNPYSK